MLAATIPLPILETTPPVTKMNFVIAARAFSLAAFKKSRLAPAFLAESD
jgi:hypothetical protein